MYFCLSDMLGAPAFAAPMVAAHLLLEPLDPHSPPEHAALLAPLRSALAPANAVHICCAEAPTWRELVELAAELLRENGIDVPPVAFDDAKENPLVSVDVGALSGEMAARLLPGWAPAPLRARLAEAVEAWVAEMRDAYDGQVRDEERRARRGDS